MLCWDIPFLQTLLKVGIKKLRIYGGGRNLLTFKIHRVKSKLVETISRSLGVDIGLYPVTMLYFGANIVF